MPVIEGLNVEEGIQNCGSEELFTELLGDFCRLIGLKCEKLERLLAENRIREYTIEVHALKNSARMIGAMELSGRFLRMEQLGNEGNDEEIRREMPALLSLYRSYQPILAEYAAGNSGEQERASAEELVALLRQLEKAVDEFEIDRADRLMQRLEGCVFPEELLAARERLHAYLADVAMEEVLRLSQEMQDALSELAEAERKKPLILLVDDDGINQKAVAGMLREHYRICGAGSGQEALEKLEARVPDLILLDVHMKGMSGHEVIRALKADERYREIPVVFLTSDEDERTEIQGFSEGATDFIRKPLRKRVAIRRIDRILELAYLQKNLRQEVEKQTEVAERRRESMERLVMQMVQALANTIDAKDSYTNGHSTRVAKYSGMLAERMGYTGERLQLVQYTALLHDIGKIGIPKEIINKPSRLTDEEYEIIKTHPSIGGKILKEITEIPDIAIGARWHHERYDGKGYPDGLQGTEIPEIARIIGVADAYDAMTSRRSYRDIIPQENVRGELERGKGCQFDPEIAALMLELIDEDKEYEMHE